VRTYVPISAMAPVVPLMVIAAEDGRFCQHWGIDLVEVRNALEDADGLDELRGASTISQQAAKNLFLWSSRSFVRKVIELPLALWLDLVLSKQRLLEIYLNVAEWGPDGEFGIEAGSRHAFARPADALTPYQAALLAAVLPNPRVRSAGRPGNVERRLAGIYQRRAAGSPDLAACIGATN
jgi:monofunctional biosynthetic peptidoglycan transglycosylase